jgi:hypothetical protein
LAKWIKNTAHDTSNLNSIYSPAAASPCSHVMPHLA